MAIRYLRDKRIGGDSDIVRRAWQYRWEGWL